MSQVKVELGADGNIVRIFKNERDAAKSLAWDQGRVSSRVYSSAVMEIRRQVLKRSKFECERCGAPITWVTFEMHERQFKSRGGDVSLRNCVALCHGCHQGPDGAHKDRRLKWTKQKNDAVDVES